VISGTARGAKLFSLPGRDVRPVSDRVKTSLYNILGTEVEGAKVLDLFAGTGALGIEALSRGAERCVFVDIGRDSVRVIRQNLEKTRLAEKAVVLLCDVYRIMPRLETLGEKFTLVIVAPPYPLVRDPITRGDLERLVAKLADGEWLVPGALIVVQHVAGGVFETRSAAMKVVDEREYGITKLTFIRKQTEFLLATDRA
jgi:16S rRNA (guanine(966)-N(2))-methyltransferase RsmD